MADLSLRYLLFGEDKSASKAIKGVADTAESSGKRFEGVSKAWQAGAALAGAAVVKMGADTVSAASDQNEVISKSSVIFGKNSDEILAWASGASKNMGLSKTAALEAASGFGDMFLQLGFAGDQASGMSTQVVQLAADLGSFNNLPTAEVADMMAGAFRGEYDSLQRLVPNINAARVETEALAMTGKSNAKQLTAQEKAAATLSIITKDSARAQGDFARTSDGLANSTKILQATFEDQEAQLGQKLLPIVNATVKGLTSAVGVVGDVIDKVSGLPIPVLAAVTAFTAWRLGGDRITGMAGRVSGAVRPMADHIRLAGMYARDAGGGFSGLRAGLSAMTGGLTAGQTATRGLRAAGSGLMGLLGGPWGVAITGATALVGAYAQAQADAKKDADDLSGAIDKQTGKWTNAAREIVANKISFDVSPEDLRALEQAGVELDKVTDAVLYGGPPLDALNAKLDGLAMEAGPASAAADGLAKTIGRERDAAVKAYAQHQANNSLLKTTTATTTTTAGATDKLKVSEEEAAAAAKKERDRLQELNDKLADAYEKTLDARGATRDYEAALDDATQAIKDNGRTVNIHTEAGRRNQAALDALAKSAVNVAEADIRAGKSTADVTAKMRTARDAFVNTAVKMGMSRDKANALATQLGLTSTEVQRLTGKVNGIPVAKKTAVSVPTATAHGQISRIKQEIADIRGKNVPVNVKVTGYAALKAVSDLTFGLAGVAATVVAKVNATGGGSYGTAGGSLARPVSAAIGTGFNGYPGHKGIDFPVPVGTPVHAMMAGTVIGDGWDPDGFGYHVRTHDADGRYSIYGHLSREIVSVGQRLSRSQVMGFSGSTGNSTGPHVHAERRTRPGSGAYNFAGALGRARGGRVWGGGLFAIGDNPDGSWNKTTELFATSRPGRVFDARTSRAIVTGGGVGSDGGDIYLTVNLRAPDGRLIQRELLTLKRTTGGQLGLA